MMIEWLGTFTWFGLAALYASIGIAMALTAAVYMKMKQSDPRYPNFTSDEQFFLTVTPFAWPIVGIIMFAIGLFMLGDKVTTELAVQMKGARRRD